MGWLNEYVQIAMPNGEIVEISWDTRVTVLRRARRVANASRLVDAFEQIGTSRPIELSGDDIVALDDVLCFWPRCAESVPAEIERLKAAVLSEIRQGAAGPSWSESANA